MIRSILLLGGAFLAALPAILSLFGVAIADHHAEPVKASVVFGIAILAGALLISIACELVQHEIPQALALVLVAFLAILPEYAVDLVFAWEAGKPAVPLAPGQHTYLHFALANMTGANRILVGLGWPLMSFLWWWRTRGKTIQLEPVRGGEIFFLGLATAYSFVIPIKGTLSVVDTAVLFAIFVLYIRFAMKQSVEEPEMHGAAALLSKLARGPRRLVTVLLFLFAGAAIFASSEPFAKGLVEVGKVLNVDQRYLVQWVAPLASESPEFVVAAIFAWKGAPTVGFGALVSSKVNQWTLLVGAVPLMVGISLVHHGGTFAPMALDDWQFAEILLTSAQSFLGICVLLNRRFDLSEALLLAVLFLAQFVTTILIESILIDWWLTKEEAEVWILREKHGFSILYGVVGLIYLLGNFRHIPPMLRLAFFPRLAVLEGMAHRSDSGESGGAPPP